MKTTVEEILSLISTVNESDKVLITKAFNFAKKAHKGQKRFSGEPYFIHPFEVAKILALMKADTETIAAGLIHDTLEDTGVTAEEIEKEFGKNILFLVEGVTKLGRVRYQGMERHTESLRKFFMAMAEDIRVVTIKLSDRLHNIRTLEHVRPDKQKRIALETLEIYAPIANRLGIWKLKGMLEDASFPYVYPEEYKKVVALRRTKGKETIKRLEKVYKNIQTELVKNNLPDARIDYRIKYLYSLYRKLEEKGMDIDQIYDISAMRVIVKDVSECYQVLGIIHSMWKPVANRFKDYIAIPKPNGYQSIHTAVFTGDGIVEIQIRSEEMHHEAEYGSAAHITYDENGKANPNKKLGKKSRWINQLLEAQKNLEGPEEFLKTLKEEFFKEHIFVFTPKGDVVEMPTEATALDFAYAIHSDIGDHAAGAKINGKFVALNTTLNNNDVVYIETKEKSHPTNKWFSYVETNSAKRHIRSFIQKQNENSFGILSKLNILNRNKNKTK